MILACGQHQVLKPGDLDYRIIIIKQGDILQVKRKVVGEEILSWDKNKITWDHLHYSTLKIDCKLYCKVCGLSTCTWDGNNFELKIESSLV